MTVKATIALGSNLGDRAGHISRALRGLGRFCTVERTASLYESAAAYVTDQPAFLNTACTVSTALAPRELLAALKGVEREIGRREGLRWGPREIDLDIVLYGDAVLHERSEPDAEPGSAASFELELPHPRLAERSFVLQPLVDLDASTPRAALGGRSAAELLAALREPPLQRVTPMGDDGALLRWGSRTHLMGVLNVTPDSFSDGGEYFDTRAAVAHALDMERCGADIIDVGAQSTRPGATLVPPEEEVRRAAPVVRALRASPLRAPISIDTKSAACDARIRPSNSRLARP